MQVLNFLCLVLLCLVLEKVAVAEECIKFEDHKDEILNCCKYQPPYPKDDVKECVQEAQGKSGGDKHEFFACLLECYLPKIGIINGDSIDEDKISEHLQSLDENARDILLAAYKECDESTTGTTRAQCSSYALDLETCVLQKLDQQCPDEFYNPSEICDKLKSGVEICH
ncbi:AAEL004730-PA [Aedes aegypti]|uniref:AAEL004730-PA n=1 Tax=Aedes aegypti TaxID=7159 RepID=Q17C48_AEDAE|nr:AAEL004730-PA [Aedes aegypti]